eukprot:1142693-Pelagomonas_calceolata.AAC.2
MSSTHWLLQAELGIPTHKGMNCMCVSQGTSRYIRRQTVYCVVPANAITLLAASECKQQMQFTVVLSASTHMVVVGDTTRASGPLSVCKASIYTHDLCVLAVHSVYARQASAHMTYAC